MLSALVYRVATGPRAAAPDGAPSATECERSPRRKQKLRRESSVDGGLAAVLDDTSFPPLPEGGGGHARGGRPAGTAWRSPAVTAQEGASRSPKPRPGQATPAGDDVRPTDDGSDTPPGGSLAAPLCGNLSSVLDRVVFPPLPGGGDEHVPTGPAGWDAGRPAAKVAWCPSAASTPGSGLSSPRSWPGKVLLADGGVFSLDDDDAASVVSSVAAPLSEVSSDGCILPPPAIALGEDMFWHKSCAGSDASQPWTAPRSRCRRTRARCS